MIISLLSSMPRGAAKASFTIDWILKPYQMPMLAYLHEEASPCIVVAPPKNARHYNGGYFSKSKHILAPLNSLICYTNQFILGCHSS